MVGEYEGWYMSYLFKSIAEYTKAEQYYALYFSSHPELRSNNVLISKREEIKKLT